MPKPGLSLWIAPPNAAGTRTAIDKFVRDEWIVTCFDDNRLPLLRELVEDTGYGYRPWKAVFIAFSLWCVATVAYTWVAYGPFPDIMGPAEGDVLAALQANPKHDWRTGGPPFVPALYALDRLMPVVDLGQASYFRPQLPTGHRFIGLEIGWLLSILDWILIASGWILSLLFAGSVSGLMLKIDSDA